MRAERERQEAIAQRDEHLRTLEWAIEPNREREGPVR